MSPSAALMLEKEIYPIIRNTIPRTARPMGSEDSQELIQDATASAAGMVAGIGFLIICAFPSCILAGVLMAFIYTEMARRGSL